MMLTMGAAIAVMLQSASAAGNEADVAYQSLVEGRNAEAIRKIEANGKLETNDPARLINLGIAYARAGNEARARQMFQAVIDSSDRIELETAEGKWVDSRRIARKAMKLLDAGELGGERMTMR